MVRTQTTFTHAQTGEKGVVTHELDQCPVCGEKDYIAIDNKTGAKLCESCGYDNSMQTKFKTAPLNL